MVEHQEDLSGRDIIKKSYEQPSSNTNIETKISPKKTDDNMLDIMAKRYAEMHGRKNNITPKEPDTNKVVEPNSKKQPVNQNVNQNNNSNLAQNKDTQNKDAQNKDTQNTKAKEIGTKNSPNVNTINFNRQNSSKSSDDMFNQALSMFNTQNMNNTSNQKKVNIMYEDQLQK